MAPDAAEPADDSSSVATAVVGVGVAAVAGRQEVDVERGAHAGELGAELGVGADVLCVGQGEVVQEGLEDGELGLQGRGGAGAQGGAVGGVVVGLQA